jgi:hypothetical protein
VLLADRHLEIVLDYHPPLEPGVDQDVHQRNRIPQEEVARNRAVDLGQRPSEVGLVGLDGGHFLELRPAEELDQVGALGADE